MEKLSVQCENTGIQVGRKRYPKDIRNLQKCGGLADAAEIDRHRYDQHQQEDDPDQREQIILAIEENNAPKEIKQDLRQI